MITKAQRWWDLPAAIFLVCALMSAAIRLHVTNWTENLGRVEVVVLLGVILGFALGKSIFRSRVTFWMGLLYSVIAIPWQLTLMMPQGEWLDRLNFLYARLYWATSDFLRNQPVKDPILFITAMLALYWFASLLSSYGLVRRANPWLPLLSLGGMILVVEYTVELYRYIKVTGGTYSLMYLVFCLLLMGRVYFMRSRREWEQRGGTVELEVGYDLGRGVLISAVVLALLAWNAPRFYNLFSSENPAQERISREWQAFRDRINKATNSLRSPSPMVVEGYGNNMFLGTGGPLGDEVVFTVKPGDGEKVYGRIYWSARKYDNYVGNGQWVTSVAGAQDMGPGLSPLKYPDWEMRKELEFTFASRISLLQTLLYPAEPITINREVQGVLLSNEDGEVDFNALVMDPPLRAGEEYRVMSTVAQPSISAMRLADDEYPQWIQDRYLQLPENFSPRIAELALQVAGNEETPYDQAIAITQYLRRTITYSDTIPEPPRNRDPLEWFLFDLRSGFCNYYASSEVLMLRSLGIPARLVAGYAQGNWDPEKQEYSVIGKDSHAWPEVYFPNVGWVVFEPTVSQPMVSFPSGGQNTPDDFRGLGSGGFEPEEEFIPPPGSTNPAEDMMRAHQNDGGVIPTGPVISPWFIGALIALLVLVLLGYLEWRRRQITSLPLPSWMERTLDERGYRTPNWLRFWSRQALRTPMENMFANVGTMLRIWGQQVDPAQTPSEQVNLLVTIVPGVGDSATALLEEYERSMYSPHPANILRARQAVENIRSVGLRNWALRLAGLEAS
jgi:hypothetical protein